MRNGDTFSCPRGQAWIAGKRGKRGASPCARVSDPELPAYLTPIAAPIAARCVSDPDLDLFDLPGRRLYLLTISKARLILMLDSGHEEQRCPS